MSFSVSVQQASLNALQAWLTQSLPKDWKISARWPDPERRLPAKAVTVIPAGPVEWTMVEPKVVGGPTSVGIAGSGAFTWLLRLGIMPVQMDVWSNTDVSRDDMMASLENVLNAGTSQTGTNAMGMPSDPFRNGVLLALGDGWSGNCDFVFNQPEWQDDPSSVQRSEYRATMRGESVFNLYGTATSVIMAQAQLKQKLSELDTPPSTMLYDIYTFGSSGKVTESSGS